MVTIYMLITFNLSAAISILTLDLGGRKDWAEELHWNVRLLQWVLSSISLLVVALPWYAVFALIIGAVPCVVCGRCRFLKRRRQLVVSEGVSDVEDLVSKGDSTMEDSRTEK